MQPDCRQVEVEKEGEACLACGLHVELSSAQAAHEQKPRGGGGGGGRRLHQISHAVLHLQKENGFSGVTCKARWGDMA